MQKFSMPTTIKKYVCLCDSESLQNPLALLHLVHSMIITNALVFTKSSESSLRLVQLFGILSRRLVLLVMEMN